MVTAGCRMLRPLAVLVCLFLFPLTAPEAGAQQTFAPPPNLRVIDTPSDSGGGLTVLWARGGYDAPEVRYQILLGDGAEEKKVAEVSADSHYVRDAR